METLVSSKRRHWCCNRREAVSVMLMQNFGAGRCVGGVGVGCLGFARKKGFLALFQCFFVVFLFLFGHDAPKRFNQVVPVQCGVLLSFRFGQWSKDCGERGFGGIEVVEGEGSVGAVHGGGTVVGYGGVVVGERRGDLRQRHGLRLDERIVAIRDARTHDI